MVCVPAMKIAPKHALAVLRQTLDLTQRQMASFAGISPPTVQAIELGKLKMSGRVASRIGEETGADIGWLLKGSPTAAVNSEGEQLTMENFLAIQTVKEFAARDPVASFAFSAQAVGFGVACLMDLSYRVHGTSRTDLFNYRIAEKVKELYEEFYPAGINRAKPTVWAAMFDAYDQAEATWKNPTAARETVIEIAQKMRKEFNARGWKLKSSSPEELLGEMGKKVRTEVRAQSKTKRARPPAKRSRGNS
jgi:transcriptional regulator with XRE-family HTH domain